LKKAPFGVKTRMKTRMKMKIRIASVKKEQLLPNGLNNRSSPIPEAVFSLI
jgi:hypothetical protein